MVEDLLFVVARAEEDLGFLGWYTIGLSIVTQKPECLESLYCHPAVVRKLLLHLFQQPLIHPLSLADNYNHRLRSPVALPDNKIPPETRLPDPIKWKQLLFKIIPNEILHHCYNQFSVFRYNINILRRLDHNGIILITSFIEPNHYFSILSLADGELTLASILSSFFINWALDKLRQLQWWDILFVLLE